MSATVRLWHIWEDMGLNGADPRIDWSPRKADAEATRMKWLAEWKAAAEEGDDVEDKVSIALVEIPVTRNALARWLYAFDIHAI